MDILCFPIHMLINLLSDVRYNQCRISTDNTTLVFLISRYLGKVLFNNVNHEVGIIVGKLADGVKQHTGKRVHGIIHFKNLCIHQRKELLVNRIKSFNLCHGDFKIRNSTLYLKTVKLHFRCCLHQNFRNGNSFCRVFRYCFYEFLFGKRLFLSFAFRF